MNDTSSLETACSLFSLNSKTKPFDTWLIVENEDVRRRAFELISTPVLQTRITTIKSLAHTILEEQKAGIRIIPPEEQYLLFSSFAKGIFPSSKSIIENLIDLYITLTLNNTDCPLDTEKGKKASEVFSKYRMWCAEHNASDAISAIWYAIQFAEQMNPACCICFGLKSTTPLAENLLGAFSSEPIIFDAEIPPLSDVEIFEYGNTREEISQTLDAICSLEESGVLGDDILLLTPTLQTTLPILEEIAAGFFVNRKTPLTFKTSERKSIQNIPVIRAVLAFVSSAYNPKETDLASILECRAFNIKRRGVTAGTLHRAVKMTGSLDWRNIGTEEDETLKTVLCDILNKAEERQKSARTMQDRISALLDDLSDLGWTTSPMTKTEDAARNAFFSLLDRIFAAGTSHAPCSIQDFYAVLSRGCRKNAGISYPENETAFRVGKLRSAAGTKTPYVFIIGLSSKSIPNISATLPLLTVQETKALLPNRYKKSAEDTAYYFEAACASASRKLTLSYAKSDGGTSFAPSPLLTRIGEPKKTDCKNPVHSVFGCQKSAGRCVAERNEIDEAFGVLDINDTAYRISSVNKAPSFEEGRFLEIYSEKKSFSPSFLETYANCPFSWYIRHHLSLENPSDFSSEPIKIGNVIHKVLERYFSVHDCITEETADLAYEELCRLTVEEMEKTGIKTPSWKAKELGYLGCAAKDSSLKKLIGIETGFAKEGYRTDSSWLEREVEADFDGIKVSGRADRVIMKENGSFMVLDYKTGNKVETNPKKSLQIPIYSEAVRQMTGGTPSVGNFVNITSDTAKLSTPFKDGADSMISDTKKHIAEIIELVKSGKIGHGDKCPDFCPYKHICRKEEVLSDD